MGRTRSAAYASALLLVATACGGGSDDSTADTRPVSVNSTTTSTAPADDGGSLAAQFATMGAKEQVAAAACNSTSVALSNLPPLTHQRSEAGGTVTVGGEAAGTIDVLGEFCGEIELLGRLPEVAATEGDQPFGATVVTPPLYVRLGQPLDRAGWYWPACDLGTLLFVCDALEFPSGLSDALRDQGSRVMEELRALPVIDPPPAATGLPDLSVSIARPREFGECQAIEITVENVGAGATAKTVEVTVGATNHTIEFFRGVEPGEAFTLETSEYDAAVIVDPAGRIRETDEANNTANTGPDPGLKCAVVPGS